MPYKSKAQMRWMHANRPDLAAEFDKETTNAKKLPERAKAKKPSSSGSKKTGNKNKARKK